MAFKHILAEAGKSVTGKVTKAIIEIEDNRIRDVQVTSIGKGYGVMSNLTGAIKLVSGKELSGAVSSLKSLAEDALGTKKTYTVRFNPSQLTLQAQGGGMVAKTNFAATGTSSVEYAGMTPRIQLGVELIFDDVSPTDTFMSDKMMVSGGAALGERLQNGINSARKKTRSVREQVEGFIAALRNPYTRNITFHWGPMSYSGVVNYLDAEYTMFSISGQPVRAKVNLGLLCVDASLSDNNMGQWEEAFIKAFELSDSTNLESAAQNVGNLLNFQL